MPSYKAIAVAILRNDHSLCTLGFRGPISEYYFALKDRPEDDLQLGFNFDGEVT